MFKAHKQIIPSQEVLGSVKERLKDIKGMMARNQLYFAI